MANTDCGGGEETSLAAAKSTTTSTLKTAGGGDESASSSPRNRVKFLCSYGGKISLRPNDGQLKYTGGETRVVALPRDINFTELVKRLNAIVEGDMVLKYQIIPEDFEALVTVRTNDDLKHMLDEHDRLEIEGNQKLRAFLFPPNPVIVENQIASTDEHRYIDAINGIVRNSSKLSNVNASQPIMTINTPSTSPKSNSPDGYMADCGPSDSNLINSFHKNSRLQMHKVHSSPSLFCLNSPPNQSLNLGNSYHYQQQHYPYHQNPPQHQMLTYQPSKPPTDHHFPMGPERMSTALQIGPADFGRVVPGPTTAHYVYSRRLGSGGHSRYAHLDETLFHNYGRFDRSDSMPRSPR
ncbi:hypothetical protein ACFE04_002093 [Oxalis oulophora]